jgi:hypothetical protein
MTLFSIGERELREAIYSTLVRKQTLEYKAGGKTLESLAEDALLQYLHILKKELTARGGFEIRTSMAEVFLDGYYASEERKWK